MRVLLSIIIVISLAIGIYILTNMNSEAEMEKDIAAEDQEYLGDIFRIDEQRISPDVEHLTLKFVLDKRLKYIDEAPPPRVTVTSDDPGSATVEAADNIDPRKPFLFPLILTKGKTELTIDYRVYCCNDGPGAVCFFKEGRIIVPVVVDEDGEEPLVIRHVIEESI